MNARRLILPLLLLSAVALADDVRKREPADKTSAASAEGSKTGADTKLIAGMSILGNQEAPKALVIVPWKSSEIGDSPGISPLLDDSRRPVDRDVFMRELAYHQLRSDSQK